MPTNHPTFDQILQQTELPDPGPEYYEARRRLWLTPRSTPSAQAPSPATEKLERILNRPNAVHSIKLWNNRLEQVWKDFSSCRKLKSRLPMALVIKVIHASWLRDKTWPVGMHAPSSEDDVVQEVMISPYNNHNSTNN